MLYHILLCEDEEEIITFLKLELEHEGYSVDIALDGQEAVNKFQEQPYHLVLLDLMLPKRNGLDVLREIRKKSNIPVIMVTARKDTYDKVALLNAGADDYLTKPFETMELLARIKRNLTRAYPQKILQLQDLILNQSSYLVKIGNDPVELTKTEFEILALLMKKCDQVLTRDEIIYHIYGSYFGQSNVVDVNIRNIRQKLKKYTTDEYIITVRGKGYIIRT